LERTLPGKNFLLQPEAGDFNVREHTNSGKAMSTMDVLKCYKGESYSDKLESTFSNCVNCRFYDIIAMMSVNKIFFKPVRDQNIQREKCDNASPHGKALPTGTYYQDSGLPSAAALGRQAPYYAGLVTHSLPYPPFSAF
jgi:hypothetical protein